MAATKTVTEVRCPKCNGYGKALGGSLCYVRRKLMQKQYRRCSNCNYKFVTYKDKETNDIYLDGKVVGKGRHYYNKEDK